MMVAIVSFSFVSTRRNARSRMDESNPAVCRFCPAKYANYVPMSGGVRSDVPDCRQIPMKQRPAAIAVDLKCQPLSCAETGIRKYFQCKAGVFTNHHGNRRHAPDSKYKKKWHASCKTGGVP
jgi:hypothetical protein